MKIMVVGGGGREHAIIKKLKGKQKGRPNLMRCPVTAALPQTRNALISALPILKQWLILPVTNKIDYAVVAPDDPLVLGAVDDALQETGIPCFGPDKKCGNH